MPIIADEKDDDGETLTLSDASGAAIADAAATGTIADAEPALPGQLVSDVEASEEDDAALSIAVTLDPAATGRVTDGGLRTLPPTGLRRPARTTPQPAGR